MVECGANGGETYDLVCDPFTISLWSARRNETSGARKCMPVAHQASRVTSSARPRRRPR
jgi:hypothetical protein